MNKKLAVIIVAGTVLLTLACMAIVFVLQKDDDNYHRTMPPEPTEKAMLHEEEEDMRKDREAFFELMHRTAPGTDWRRRDADLRYTLMQERAAAYALRTEDAEWDTLAGGAVLGTWDEIGSFNTAGRIWATEVDFEEDVVYAFTDGGNLWKGDLDGENWSILNDHFKIAATNFLRKVDERLIVGTYQWGLQGVFYTEDEGITWTETTGLENVEAWGYVMDVEMLNDDMHTMYALAYEWDYTNWWDIISLYRSTDLGASFEKITQWDVPVYGGANNFVMWSPPYGTASCYLIENENTFLLDAAGMPQPLGVLPLAEDGEIMLCGFEGPSATSLYAAHKKFSDNTTDFYRSADGGLTWALTGGVEEGNFSRTSFNCSQQIEGYLYYGGVDSYRSFSGGTSWVRNNYWWEYYDDIEYNLHADIPFIRSFIDPATDDEIVLISTDGGLYITEDHGMIWTNITNEGMRNAQYYDVYTYRYVTDFIFAGSQDQGYQRSSYKIGDDHYFDQLISGDYGHIVTRSGGDNLWCVYPGFAMYIRDAAADSDMFFWDFQGYGHLWMAPIMADPFDDEVAWWGGGSDAGGAYLWRLEKSGPEIISEKQTKNFSVAGGGSISAIAYSPIDPNYWYLLTSGGKFYYSEDAGANWTMSSGFTGPGPQYFYGATIVPSSAQLGVVYIGGSGYDNPPVYVSSDHGDNFTALSDGLPGTLVYDLAVTPDDSLLFAATEVAPYVCVLSTGTWYNLAGTDAPLQTYWSADYIEEIHAVRFGTYGRGTWEFKLYEEPAISVEDQVTELAMEVYPNPADAFLHVTVPVHLPDAQVQIVDMQGKVVWQRYAALNRDIPFKIDLSGVAQGTYFVVVQQDERRMARKFVRS